LQARAADVGELAAVVHRVVHGGERFQRATLIDADVLKALDALGRLAPLHNPVAAATLRAAKSLLPEHPHVAVFDTGFHATLPPRAREHYEEYSLCATCGRVYWKGTHYERMRRLVEAVLARPTPPGTEGLP